MGLEVSVPGGTHAGWRRVKEARKPWTCPAGHDNPGYVVRCLECKAPST